MSLASIAQCGDPGAVGCESEGCGLLRGIKKPSTFPSAD
jgi:hypothetical protein